MRKQFPALIGDGFDYMTLNMRTDIIVVDDDMVLFARSFRFDFSVKAIKLCEIDIVVDIEFSLAFFVRNPPLLALIVVTPQITNPV